MVSDVFFELAGDHFRVLSNLKALLLPSADPLRSADSENSSVVEQKGRVQVAVVVVCPETQLFLSREGVTLLGAHFYQFFKQVADLTDGEGESTDKEFANKQQNTAQACLVVLR